MLLCVMAPHQWTVPTLGEGQDASFGDFMPQHALDICGDESVVTSVGFRGKLARQIAEILKDFFKTLMGSVFLAKRLQQLLLSGERDVISDARLRIQWVIEDAGTGEVCFRATRSEEHRAGKEGVR